MSKVIGFKPSSFITPAPENKKISGVNIYVTYPLGATEGDGFAAERIYLTDEKLAKCGYKPVVGNEINVVYNRYGKPDAIQIVRQECK